MLLPIAQEGLCRCPSCGCEPLLLRDSTKSFQVRCMNCGARTRWQKKADAICEWFNMYMVNKGIRRVKPRKPIKAARDYSEGKPNEPNLPTYQLTNLPTGGVSNEHISKHDS